MRGFGFFGKPQGVIEIEANGEVSGAARKFMFQLANRTLGFQRTGRAEFDYDNTGNDPDQQALLTAALTAFSPINNRIELTALKAVANDVSFMTLNGFPLVGQYYSGNIRQFHYNSIAVLAPATRKNRLRIHRPDQLDQFGIRQNTNNAAKSSVSNDAAGTFLLDLQVFNAVRAVIMEESWISILNIRPNKALESFALIEHPNLSTVNGKLPSSIKYLCIGSAALTSINNLISECVNLLSFVAGRYSPFPTVLDPLQTLTGTLDISHMTSLQELVLLNQSGLSGLNFPTIPANQWKVFHVQGSNGIQHTTTAYLLNVVQSTALLYFNILNGNKTWNQNFGNAEISNLLVGFNIADNIITGDITITAARLALKTIILGLNQNENNHFTNINLSGLNGGALETLQMNGVRCANVTLPSSLPNLTSLQAYDNELDQGTNSDLVTKINSYIALTDLQLSNFATSALSTNHFGQNSTNGLGTNPNFSALVNVANFYVAMCKIVGTLTLPAVAKIVNLTAAFNTSLTGFVNFLIHATTLTQMVVHGCTSLVFAITNAFTSLNSIRCNNTLVTVLDFSGKTSTTGGFCVVASNCSQLASIAFPTAQNRCTIVTASGQVIQVTDNPLLTSLANIENLNWAVTTGTTNNVLDFRNCALNMTFPFGTNNFIPNVIEIQGNGMSQANVDATINNIVMNASDWDGYSTKTLNIGGSNAAPSGLLQAPPGGNPIGASGKEQIYWLGTVKGWTINFTA